MISSSGGGMDSIEGDPRNHAAVAGLVEALQRRQGIIPFVGAGLSYEWRFPLWDSFLMSAAKTCGVESGVAVALAANDYEGAADVLEVALGRRKMNRLIARTFGGAVDPRLRPSAAVHALPALAAGPVITTNFDHVLETVFRAAGRPFDLPPIWGARAQLALDGFLENYSLLVKVHGDASHPGDRVLTLAEYARHYGGGGPDEIDSAKPLPLLLHRLFASRSVLFVGCSLQADRSMSVLRLAALGPERLPHYAVVEAPTESAGFDARAAFLEAHGITPIWYPRGHHHLVGPFLEFLKARAPRRRGGYGGVPAAVPVVPSPESVRRTREARKALGDRERRLRDLIAEGERVSDLGERIAWFRRHRGELQYDAPEAYLRFASRLSVDARHEQPAAAAESLIGSYIVGWVNGDRRAVEKLEEAAELLRPLEPEIVHVDLLHTRALHAERRRDFAAAERHSRAALRMARATGLDAVYAWIKMWKMRSKIMSELAQHRRAKRYAARAIRAARRQDRDGLVHLWIHASNLYFDAGQSRKMVRAVQRALRRVPAGDVRQRATICDNLGVGLFELGDYPRSIAAYREALWYEQQVVSDPASQVITLMNIGWFEFNAYDGRDILGPNAPAEAREEALRRARDHYAQALAMAEAAGEAQLVAHILTQQALVLAAMGEVRRALADLRHAARDARSRGDDYLVTVLNNRGRVWEHAPHGMPHVMRAYVAALREARRRSDSGVLRTVLFNYADALERLGRTAEALALAEELALLDRRRPDAFTGTHQWMLLRLREKLGS